MGGLYVCMYVYMNVCMMTEMFSCGRIVCMNVCMNLCMYECMYDRDVLLWEDCLYECMNVCLNVSMNVCMHLCV